METCLPMEEDGKTSLVRMTHKATVTSRREPWVTRRMIVDSLTPYLVNLGLKTEKRGRVEDWDSAAGWLPFTLVVGDGPCSEDAGGGPLSAGCLAGRDVRWAATSVSGSALEDAGGLGLSLYPISPCLLGNGSACGRAVDP